MYFDENFVKSLPNDPYVAIMIICDKFSEIFCETDSIQNMYDLAVETVTFLLKFDDLIGVKINLPKTINNNRSDIEYAYQNIMNVRSDALGWSTQSQFERYENLLTAKFGKGFYYEFSEGDLKQIQKLINELRDLIVASEELEEAHKHRLLRKLEKLQSELHKKISDLDRWWGFFIDASIVLGLMGENVKPIVDRIKELVDIIWPVQTRAYDLPSSLPFKLLGQAENDKSKDAKS